MIGRNHQTWKFSRGVDKRVKPPRSQPVLPAKNGVVARFLSLFRKPPKAQQATGTPTNEGVVLAEGDLPELDQNIAEGPRLSDPTSETASINTTPAEALRDGLPEVQSNERWPESPPTPDTSAVGLGVRQWVAAASTAVGASHVRLTPPVPCQDACVAKVVGRPHIVLADGVGSALLSHIGAEVLVRMVSCLIDSQEDFLSDLLDDRDAGDMETRQRASRFARMVTRYGASVLRDTARQMAHPVSEFQSTLLLVVVGKSGVFWSQIGDGAILIQEDGGIRSVSPRDERTFVNVVTVVGEAENMETIPFGIIPSSRVLGIAACSDGSAERLVSGDHSRVAGRLGAFLGQLRDGSLRRQDLYGFLIDADVWRGTTGDDKSLGLLSR